MFHWRCSVSGRRCGYGAAAVIAVVVAGAGFAAATGACAKEAKATPDKTEAAIRDLIFNMV
ncbi:MAG: hypothetical protein ABIZ09_10805, partial [Rhodoferax sp.]